MHIFVLIAKSVNVPYTLQAFKLNIKNLKTSEIITSEYAICLVFSETLEYVEANQKYFHIKK